MKNILLFIALLLSCSVICQTNPSITPPNNINFQFRILRDTPTVNPPPPPPPEVLPREGERMIFFVHGLGGTSDSWIRAADATEYKSLNIQDFPARDAFTRMPTYNEISLTNAALGLQRALEDYTPFMLDNDVEPTNNFIIAHSQGGVVSRENDRLVNLGNEKLYNGIVTFGTPHQGAQILNNSPHMAQDFANEACNELLAGPLTEGVNKSFIKIVTNQEMVEELLQAGCGIINPLVPVIFQDYSSGITEDYKVGATAITNLNASPTSIHRIGFYGIEEEPIIWRTVTSLEVAPPNGFDYFEADKDDHLIEPGGTVFSEMIDYHNRYVVWKAIAESRNKARCTWQWSIPLWIPACISYENGYFDAVNTRNAYKRGVDWWDRANDNYKEIIGALSKQVQTKWFCVCEDPHTGVITRIPISDPSLCTFSRQGPANICFPEEITTVTLVYKKSDGVVLKESGGNFPGADFDIKLGDSNHQQMRNDSRTKWALRNLYNGAYNSFFYTVEK